MATTHFSGPVKIGTSGSGATDNQGWVVASQTNTLTFADTTSKTLFVLPATAQILEVYVDVTTLFNSSGTDTVSVGTSLSATAFVNAADVSTAGRKLGSAGGATQLTNYTTVGATPVTVLGIYAQSVADANAGAATVTVVYVQK